MELRIRNLYKRYPNGVQALSDVSLDIKEGMFGLLGPNGAGKSTLMRILATLQEADRGEACLDGLDVLREKDQVRRLLGYLPQEFGLYPKVTAMQMLDHFAALKGIGPRRHRSAVVEELLHRANLHAFRHRRLGTFSGGMKQRFGVAQALLGDPKLIIVDEPTAGLDPEERTRFLNLLSEIGERVVVILSTHIVADVEDLCPQMAILHQGRVVAAGEPSVLADRLKGRVWRRVLGRGETPSGTDDPQLLRIGRLAGRLAIHLLADDRPGPGFEPIEPDIADLYFAATKGWAKPDGAAFDAAGGPCGSSSGNDAAERAGR